MLVRHLASGDWEPDEPAVFEALCEIVVPIRFPDGDRGDIAAFLDKIQSRSCEVNSERRLVLEQVIDVALGRTRPSTVEDVPRRAALMRTVLLGAIGIERRIDSDAVDRAVVAAEKLAITRGYRPRLADGGRSWE
jgi:hypothetical protein